MTNNDQHTSNSLKKCNLKLRDDLKYNLKENDMPTVKTFIRNALLLMCIFLTASCSAGNINPEIITVMGGPHPSALPEQVLQNKEIDFVVMGEGEYSFRDLLRGIETSDFSKLDGIAYKQNGKVNVIAKSKFIENLDELNDW